MSQLTFQTIGGATVTVKARGKHYIEPRGYAAPPGTGPVDHTCGSCKFIIRARRFAKCDLRRRTWTCGRGTDILAKASACREWKPDDRGGE